MGQADAELGGEELGHRLLQVEQDARPRQVGHGSDENQGVGHRVDLYDVESATEVGSGHDGEGKKEESAVLDEEPQCTGSGNVAHRQPVYRQATAPLVPRLPDVPLADDHHLMTGCEQGVNLALQPAVSVQMAPHHAHVCHIVSQIVDRSVLRA
jgi:hypothetical protein